MTRREVQHHRTSCFLNLNLVATYFLKILKPDFKLAHCLYFYLNQKRILKINTELFIEIFDWQAHQPTSDQCPKKMCL